MNEYPIVEQSKRRRRRHPDDIERVIRINLEVIYEVAGNRTVQDGLELANQLKARAVEAVDSDHVKCAVKVPATRFDV